MKKITLLLFLIFTIFGQSINARKANFILPFTIITDRQTGQNEAYVLIIRNTFRNRGWEFPGGLQDNSDRDCISGAAREFIEETAGIFIADLNQTDAYLKQTVVVDDYFQGDRQNNFLFDEAICNKLLRQPYITFQIGSNRMYTMNVPFIRARDIMDKANRIRNEGQRFACKIESTDFRWISLESLSKAVNKIKKKIIHGTVNILLKPLGSNETEIFNFTAYALRMLFQRENFEKFKTFKENILTRSRRRGPRRQKRRRRQQDSSEEELSDSSEETLSSETFNVEGRCMIL